MASGHEYTVLRDEGPGSVAGTGLRGAPPRSEEVCLDVGDGRVLTTENALLLLVALLPLLLAVVSGLAA